MSETTDAIAKADAAFDRTAEFSKRLNAAVVYLLEDLDIHGGVTSSHLEAGQLEVTVTAQTGQTRSQLHQLIADADERYRG